MTTALERRLAGIEAALDELAPKPSAYDQFIAENPWIDWMTCDELSELEEIMRAAEAETVGDLGEADLARANAIYFAAEARRLSGAPKDIDLPEESYEVRMRRSYERNNAEYERRKRAMELKER
jgi:hypothetical protein